MTELFKDFEVNREPRGPSVLKVGGLVGAGSRSVDRYVLCMFRLFGTCFNIAGLVADTRFVDKDYERTQIGDDVQFVHSPTRSFVIRTVTGRWRTAAW